MNVPGLETVSLCKLSRFEASRVFDKAIHENTSPRRVPRIFNFFFYSLKPSIFVAAKNHDESCNISERRDATHKGSAKYEKKR